MSPPGHTAHIRTGPPTSAQPSLPCVASLPACLQLKGEWESVVDLIDSKNGTALLWTAVQAALPELGDLGEALSSEFSANIV